tara:strand:+ start:7423 stop:7647 length:225 start_codon:yes stop_codon:yes gene_type:complete
VIIVGLAHIRGRRGGACFVGWAPGIGSCIGNIYVRLEAWLRRAMIFFIGSLERSLIHRLVERLFRGQVYPGVIF